MEFWSSPVLIFDDLVKSRESRHSCEACPGESREQESRTTTINLIPAFAGMTKMGPKGLFTNPSFLVGGRFALPLADKDCHYL
jgi:hypothetical protein